MRTIVELARDLVLNEDGPTAVEYAVMLGLLIVVMMVAIGAIGLQTSTMLDNLALKNALSGES